MSHQPAETPRVPRQAAGAADDTAGFAAGVQRTLVRRAADLAQRRGLDVLADWLEDLAGTLREAQTRPWDQGALRETARDQFLRRLGQDGGVGDGVDESDPALQRAVGAVRELVSILETEHAFRAIVDASGDVVLMVDDGVVTFASPTAGPALGWAVAELRGQPLSRFVHPEDLERAQGLFRSDDEPGTPGAAGVAGGLADPGALSSVVRFRISAKDRGWRTYDWWVTRRGDTASGPVILTGRDVSDRVEIERELLRQAVEDDLTGLPNRRAIMELTAGAVARSVGRDEGQDTIGVIMIDLDRFKDVNDSLGHAVGDLLLAQVGPRLRAGLRPGDVIARLGGDEFAVLLENGTIDSARLVAERLAAELDAPFLIDGMELTVDASFGIAVTTAGGRAPREVTEALLRKADIAMYRAKEAGSGIAVFDPERDAVQNRSRLELHADLRRAVSEGQLVVHYQPVIDILEGRLAGVEALVRWQHPERGLIPPADFLPFAEQSGLVVSLSKVVLTSAVAQAAAWAARGRVLEVAVNLSPRWLQHGDVPDIVAQVLEENGMAPSQLRLEITETVVLADPAAALSALERLREMGVGLSLDDFGTGYSSMTYLRSLPVDQLKVDRGFVQAMTTSPEDAVIVRAAIELGHSLGMEVIAEGIEDADTLSEIVAAGCCFAQGYYFSRPLPADDLTAWADERFPC